MIFFVFPLFFLKKLNFIETLPHQIKQIQVFQNKQMTYLYFNLHTSGYFIAKLYELSLTLDLIAVWNFLHFHNEKQKQKNNLNFSNNVVTCNQFETYFLNNFEEVLQIFQLLNMNWLKSVVY